MAQENGLSTVEPLVGRISSWRSRHRSQAQRVHEYRVEYDGSVLASLSAREKSTLDDELAAAAWELAQGLARAATVDVIAADAENNEIARVQLRVLPATQPATPPANAEAVIQLLIRANESQQKMINDLLTSMTANLRELASANAAFARAAGARTLAAENEASEATATLREAIALATDGANAQRRDVRERGLDLVESYLRNALQPRNETAAPATAPEATAPATAPEATAAS